MTDNVSAASPSNLASQIAGANGAISRAHDRFDLPITGADKEAAKGYDNYVTEFLGYGQNLRDLFDIADAAPDSALINAHAAVLHMAFEGAEGFDAAQPYLQRMRDARRLPLSDRENLFCDATEAWAVRDWFQALRLLDALTVRWPADLCAIKWGQYHAFNLGDQPALLRFGQRARIVHEETPYAHGMIAFALEQNHNLSEAEAEGKRAVEIAPDDAWAHHAVAHVFETRQKIGAGIKWMDRHAHTWDRKGIFIRDHNWWHAALFHLAADNRDEVLNIFDKRLWGAWPEFPQEQIGAVSMLWRLEILGTHPGSRWSPVVEQVRARAGEHILPFHDLHYAYALARRGDGPEGDAFLESLESYAGKCEGEAAQVWGGVCLPLAKAVTAFARDEYQHTVDLMTPVLPDLHRIGGSHAQRQIFLDTYETARARIT